MVGIQQPRNIAQKVPNISVKGTIIDIVTAKYTCPAGKKALVNITGILVSYGATTQCGIALGGVNLINFVFGTDVLGTSKTINSVVLNAGETIIGQGNAANPTVNFSASIQESPL